MLTVYTRPPEKFATRYKTWRLPPCVTRRSGWLISSMSELFF
jgi:hypothetical protein